MEFSHYTYETKRNLLFVLKNSSLHFIHVNFQDLWNKFSLIFGQLCDKKTCAFVVMRIGNKVVWAGCRMGRGH